MYMVTPSIWELVKKCVNEHELNILLNLNKENKTDMENPISLIENITDKDITPIDPLEETLQRPAFMNPNVTNDLSRTIYQNPNVSLQGDPNQFKPNESFRERMNKSIMVRDPLEETFNTTNPNRKRFRVIDNDDDEIYLMSKKQKIDNMPSIPLTQAEFQPRETSSPIPNRPMIPVLPLSSCQKTDTNKPFTCEQCGRGFTRKYSLTRHLMTVHKPKPAETQTVVPVRSLRSRKRAAPIDDEVLQNSKYQRLNETFDKWQT